MHRMYLSCCLLLVACGGYEGDWEGECENPATGETRSFDIDIDEDKGDELEGFAYMDIQSPTGELSRVGCDVVGTVDGSDVDLDFSCENGDQFTIKAVKTGGNLVGYCDSNNEVELVLEPD